ncbi:MAG: hypothetical protein GC159_12950 [Phycisphaera sp.]|nr:hypothetical protein [Phycisphaera sp.]
MADNMLKRGSDWLERMRTAHMSSPVKYRRPPATEAVIVNATFGKTNIEIAEEGGTTIESHVWDFLILAEELSGPEPEPGDVIAADGRLYEVMALGNDIKGWRWSDPFRQTYRIHTKDIGATA